MLSIHWTRMDTDQVIDAAYECYWNIDNTDIIRLREVPH